MEWGINKCAAIHMKRGKLITNNNSSAIPVSNNCTIPALSNDDHYKFLGEYQNTHRNTHRRSCQGVQEPTIGSLDFPIVSPTQGPRNEHLRSAYLTNCMWSTDWCINNLKELDRLTRHGINECSGKHKYESTRLLCLSSEDGGKELIEIESLLQECQA